MSIAALVVRHLTVLALTGQTLAGNAVRSSLLVPINEIGDGQSQLIIAVFTDTAKATAGQIEGHDLIGADSEVTLALEIACFNQAPTKDGRDAEIFIPETDEGLETAIDIIERQALAELQAGESSWSILWRAFRLETCGLHAVRGAAVENTVRFAARRVELVLKLVSDPVPGAPLSEAWADVFAAFTAAGGGYAKLAATLRTVVGGGALPEWKQWRNELGVNDEAMTMIGLGPIAGQVDPAGDLVEATQLAGEGLGATITVEPTGATMTLDDDPDHAVALYEVNPNG